ncbi:MAG: hypothetical protein AAGD86_01940 [Pseudomonadota bacterium]
MSNKNLATWLAGTVAAALAGPLGAAPSSVCNSTGCIVYDDSREPEFQRVLFTDGTWSSGTSVIAQFGGPGDYAIGGDWDPFAPAALGTFSDGVWRIRKTNGLFYVVEEMFFGPPDGVPVVGDWDGDGRLDLGVVHGATWHLMIGRDPSTAWQVQFGRPDSRPVVGDWDDDGIDTLAFVYKNVLYYRNTNAPGIQDTLTYTISSGHNDSQLHPIAWNEGDGDRLAFAPGRCLRGDYCTTGGAIVVTTGPGRE